MTAPTTEPTPLYDALVEHPSADVLRQPHLRDVLNGVQR